MCNKREVALSLLYRDTKKCYFVRMFCVHGPNYHFIPAFGAGVIPLDYIMYQIKAADLHANVFLCNVNGA